MADYKSFKDEWNGRRIDYDHVYSYQCVDLILEYYKEIAGQASGIWGNAIDYWTKPTAAQVSVSDRVGAGDVKQGDVVVLSGLAGNPYGHIGIFDTNGSTTFRMLEQNGAGSGTGTGKDAVGVWRDIPKSRILGGWRLRGAAAPTVPPARSTVFLPSSVPTWRLYYIGSYLRPNTTDQKAVLAPRLYPPGLTYKIEGWVGDYAVIITTQMFGRGVIWVKNTEAVIQ